MSLNPQPSTLNQRKALLFPLCAIGCYWVVLIYYLGAQWSVYEQYNYGWAVPFLCAYLLWRRVAQASPPATQGSGFRVQGSRLNVQCSTSDVPPAPLPSSLFSLLWQRASPLRPPPIQGSEFEVQGSGFGARSAQPSSLFYLLLAVCAFLYLPTRFLHEANPIWRLTSLLWTLEVIGLTLLTVHLVQGRWSVVSGQKSEVSSRSSIFHLPSSLLPFQLSAFSFSDFVFPACFFLVAVPWPSGLENFLTQSLMRCNVATTIELLGVFGVPAIQHGNVIEIATGKVGIDEACSGIRSFQAALMISLFFGEVCRLTVLRRVWLVVLGFVLAFAFNVGRTLLLTHIGSAKGVGAVATWHDPAGVTILVACFLCLWLIARALRKAESRKQKAEIGGQSGGGKTETLKAEMLKSCAVSFSVSAFQRFSICLIAWLLLVEGGTELWYRSHEHSAAGTKEWSVNLDVAEPAVTKIEIPPQIRGQFKADQSLQGRWQDSSGNAWQLYYFRWLPAHSLKGRVAIQLAKVHGPEICLPAAGMTLESYLGVITVPLGDMELALQQYLFTTEGKPIHVFYGIYEDPTRSAVLANRRQNTASRIAGALAGSRNYAQRFLEVAVFGYEKPEDAKAALTRELEKLIKIEKPTDH